MSFTKRNHKKFFLTSGLVLGLYAVITTTYAAFVITGGGNNPGTVNPAVSAEGVSNKALDVTVSIANNNKLSLEPKATDKEGRLQYQDKSSSENLNLTLNISVTGDTSLFNRIDISAKASKKDANGKDDLFTLKFLDFKNVSVAKEATWSVTGEGSNAVTTITKEVAFSWGTAFGGINPSEYYEEGKGGASVSNKDMETSLNSLKDSAANTNITLSVNATNA